MGKKRVIWVKYRKAEELIHELAEENDTYLQRIQDTVGEAIGVTEDNREIKDFHEILEKVYLSTQKERKRYYNMACVYNEYQEKVRAADERMANNINQLFNDAAHNTDPDFYKKLVMDHYNYTSNYDRIDEMRESLISLYGISERDISDVTSVIFFFEEVKGFTKEDQADIIWSVRYEKLSKKGFTRADTNMLIEKINGLPRLYYKDLEQKKEMKAILARMLVLKKSPELVMSPDYKPLKLGSPENYYANGMIRMIEKKMEQIRGELMAGDISNIQYFRYDEKLPFGDRFTALAWAKFGDEERLRLMLVSRGWYDENYPDEEIYRVKMSAMADGVSSGVSGIMDDLIDITYWYPTVQLQEEYFRGKGIGGNLKEIIYAAASIRVLELNQAAADLKQKQYMDRLDEVANREALEAARQASLVEGAGEATGKTYTVDPSMQAKDIELEVLDADGYIKNPTATNINDLVSDNSKYIGSKQMNGEFMYVADADGNIIIGTRAGEHMPHPTLIGGENPVVQGAGIIEIRAGKIYSIDNGSGHFKPDISSLINVEEAFQQLPDTVFHKNFQGFISFE